MNLMDNICYTFITEKTKNYSSWNEVFKDGTILISEIGNLINPHKTENECEQWIFNTEHFLKSQKLKEDYGFSRPLFFILKKRTNLTTLINRRESFDTEELKMEMERKINTLRTIKDSVSSSISKTKIFDYKEGQYFLNGQPINPNKSTLYYVLFDATYKIAQNGGDILYTNLRQYLKKNKMTYKIKGKSTSFWECDLGEIKEKVQNNLCGGKGILKLVKIKRLLLKNQKDRIFIAIPGNKAYSFDNTR